MAEFDGVRAKMYEEALLEYPNARKEDILAMKKFLNPKKGEKILGFGEGNGFFCQDISNSLGEKGEYVVSDPSLDQLNNLKKKIKSKNVKVIQSGAENIKVKDNYFDKVWSFGAIHHCPDKISAFQNIFNSLRIGGKAVICDVFQESKLAKHFDVQVDRYCVTGHKVIFLSDESSLDLLTKSGFKKDNIKILDLLQKWTFDSEEDLGRFIYKLHAMIKIPGTEEEKIKEVIRGCKEILGVKKVNSHYDLNWPMKVIIADK